MMPITSIHYTHLLQSIPHSPILYTHFFTTRIYASYPLSLFPCTYLTNHHPTLQYPAHPSFPHHVPCHPFSFPHLIPTKSFALIIQPSHTHLLHHAPFTFIHLFLSLTTTSISYLHAHEPRVHDHLTSFHFQSLHTPHHTHLLTPHT